MKNISFTAVFAAFVLAGAACAQTSTVDPTVRFNTTEGVIDVILTPEAAPNTVANFLNYVKAGAYVNTMIHRSVPNFVIQGGGYQLQNGSPVTTPTSAPINNEVNVTNQRGTLAMAMTSSPNSATDQWFFNLINNGPTLDPASNSGGFTVFGRVANATGLAVMDKIAALPTADLTSVYASLPFSQVPLQNYAHGAAVTTDNFVLVTSIVQLPFVKPTGITDAASFASSLTSGIAPGELLTVFGAAIGPATLTTLALDATGVTQTSLGGTRVLFNGFPAPLIYTSSGQLSVVAPQSIAGLKTVQVVVEYQNVQTAGMQFPVATANPALFTLNASGSGDAAIIQQNGSIVSTASPAKPGDVLTLYGEGYGTATPATAAADGAIVGSTLPVPTNPVTLLLDGQPVSTLYAGGAPALINGVLQVNFTVPPGTLPGSHRIQIQVAGQTSPAGVNLQTK